MAAGERGKTSSRGEARQWLFCYFLARLGNPREAAVQAGYPAATAAAEAARLMELEPVRTCVLQYQRRQQEADSAEEALRGLKRLAFGPVNDAVQLVMADPDGVELDVDRLDLFAVSEIKRPKGGGFEIKFHDRLAALRAILEQRPGSVNGDTDSLYRALERSVEAVGNRDPNGL